MDGGPRLRFIVIGGGMAGILATIKLQEAGFDDIVVYEKADRLGGTWRDNTYPGIGCDVPSHLYCYSFAPNPEWSHLFSPGEEILAYFEGIARRYGVDRRVRLYEEVLSATWVDGRWQVETSAGRRDEADVLIAATGVLHHPRYPDIEGLGTFAGAAFHSARWDHSVRIDGARLGVVGTGSSAVQIVGAVVDRVARLVVFQRTAQWILPQNNRPYREDEKARFREDPRTMVELHEQLSATFSGFANAVVDADSPQMKAIEELCRANLENSVRDPVLRGYRAPRRREALEGSALLRIAWPAIKLCTYYAQLLV
ncbi:MAG: NAD(P)/FAD-dependent oxidoreductase, partial [Chloroflexota bacterium]